MCALPFSSTCSMDTTTVPLHYLHHHHQCVHPYTVHPQLYDPYRMCTPLTAHPLTIQSQSIQFPPDTGVIITDILPKKSFVYIIDALDL